MNKKHKHKFKKKSTKNKIKKSRTIKKSRKMKTRSKKMKKDGFNGHFYLSPNSGLYLSPTMMDPFREYIDEIDDKSIKAAREMSILNLFLDPPYKKKPLSSETPKKDSLITKNKDEKKTPKTDSLITKNKDENKTPKTDSLVTKKVEKTK